ncbi:hypothetical protein SK128_014950 [Halocaridina rubra]|uniref:Uncharacterized protein n=1 Tax=Halocaridina rubra TaxID=373956 RepID=A0AAN8WP51_HALRR
MTTNMMTPTRKSGRQPKLSTKLKEYLYENDMERMKESLPRTAEKRKLEIKKEPESPPPVKKKATTIKKEPVSPSPQRKKAVATKKDIETRTLKVVVKKEPESRLLAKKKNLSEKKESAVTKKRTPAVKTIKKGPEDQTSEKQKFIDTSIVTPDSGGPSRKSRRTPKPAAKLQEFVYEDERENSVDSVPVKKTDKNTEKRKRALSDDDDDDASVDSSDLTSSKKSEMSVSSRDSSSDSETVTSPRARVTNLTSISAKKGKLVSAHQLTVEKGKIGKVVPKSSVSAVTVKHIKTGKVEARTISSVGSKKPVPMTAFASSRKVNYLNRPTLNARRIAESTSNAAKNSKGAPVPTKAVSKVAKPITQKKTNSKPMRKIEKKEIEKVLQVNKEVMTQLLNFGAEVAEAMASNNESIFSFSKNDNPLQSFKIDRQDDFSDEEVVNIIKWFEEEEEQRRAYRKRILEALRASHETNMSLYTQMLKMLQSVTAS